MTDILMLPPPPHRFPVPFHDPLTKLGYPYAVVDPRKVVAVIETDEPDKVPGFAGSDARSEKIAEHVVRFLLDEMLAGRIPKEFLPLRPGVGNEGNGVMSRWQETYGLRLDVYGSISGPLVDLMRREAAGGQHNEP